MPPVRGRKRKSDQSIASNEDHTTDDMAGQKVPTKTGSPTAQESPTKKRRTAITVAQKQALIDNLQLEITERARKLRATYNIHAQSLRTRIEIRVNRIPLSLRKVKMGDLVQKYSVEQQQKAVTAPSPMKPPRVPEKDARPTSQRSHLAAQVAPARPAKRPSHEMSGGDKENEVEHVENAKKKVRGGVGPAMADVAPRNPAQILSPASSNSRVAPRSRGAPTPGRSGIARPVSPTKPTGLLNNMMEKARSTRAAATARKTTTSSTASSSNSSATTSTATRTTTRRGAAGATTTHSRPPTRAALSRAGNRVSAISESSDGSTSTVVRRRPGTTTAAPKTAAAPAATKRTVMSTIKKGVTGSSATKKAPATKAAAPASTTGTGRVLRKRA
ncbi:Borealin N terminal-domain-containing protein [Diplogelasinospora grovesii]|uniref:Borealin N terminal-domain-containing protein n=1 Tax=Diplogelasinospora grovesii TaxID=303347 RepID=A0AAN6N0X9_9PEZI|nr:Borealin N terminal-domain-containing protein [Diplogelasinospora grovesii]